MSNKHNDPTEHAARRREYMAEAFRIGQETNNEKIKALTTVMHEASRTALQIEREEYLDQPRTNARVIDPDE